MKALILTFFLFILGFSVLTNNKEVEPEVSNNNIVQEKASLDQTSKDSVILYTDNRIKIAE